MASNIKISSYWHTQNYISFNQKTKTLYFCFHGTIEDTNETSDHRGYFIKFDDNIIAAIRQAQLDTFMNLAFPTVRGLQQEVSLLNAYYQNFGVEITLGKQGGVWPNIFFEQTWKL